jgi:hypothetical protein
MAKKLGARILHFWTNPNIIYKVAISPLKSCN